jgi:hypothetical protein
MALVSMLLTIGCTTKGEANVQGKLLSIEDIQKLSLDHSQEGKLVTIEGYAGVCKLLNKITLGGETPFEIYADQACKGETIGKVMLSILNINSKRLIGEEPRNYVKYNSEKEATNKTLEIVTDDYSEVHNQKLKFSGNIAYDKKQWYLKNVTIHL